jgi:SAM-dependent methyltransferase
VTTGSERRSPAGDAVAWHTVECGAYRADLDLWRSLAEEIGGPLLELGAGTGRVALALARWGHEVIAVEREPALGEELRRRAARADGKVTVVCADLRELEPAQLPSPPALLIGPMHVLQEADRSGRAELLSAAIRLCRPGATFAFALVEESYLSAPGGAGAPLLPDLMEIDGRVFSSEPLWVQVSEEAIRVRRLRQRVDPDGELTRSVHHDVLHRLLPDELEREAAALGLRPRGRRPVATGPTEADSIVCLLEAP